MTVYSVLIGGMEVLVKWLYDHFGTFVHLKKETTVKGAMFHSILFKIYSFFRGKSMQQ